LQAIAGRDMTAPMTKVLFRPAAFLAVQILAYPALASSSDWHEAQGGRVRLLTSGQPDENGVLKGALEVDLKPGWKTYWLDPGDAGVPPSLDVSGSRNVATAEMQLPAPHRFDDGAKWVGYKGPVTFAVNFTLADRTAPATVDAKVFLGICETICVPLQASLHVDAASDPDNADDAATVQAAFDSLPGPEQPDFGVTLVGGGKDEVVVEAAYPGEPNAVDFFLAGSAGYLFGPPERRLNGEQLVFSVPILERPDKTPDRGGLLYTLVSQGGAVSGTLPYPSAP
jgi:DsbC/DsbD-like thiol-disulfide interchange protein